MHTLHDMTLHYITLHCIISHYIVLHYITSHYIILHYITKTKPRTPHNTTKRTRQNRLTMYVHVRVNVCMYACTMALQHAVCLLRDVLWLCSCFLWLTVMLCDVMLNGTLCVRVFSVSQIVIVFWSVRKMISNIPCTGKSHMLWSTVYLEATCALQHHNAYFVKLSLTSTPATL